ncbi:hypothetical protein AAKU58_000939 [Oxalobacteraceae bacterium GrIS 1.18]
MQTKSTRMISLKSLFSRKTLVLIPLIFSAAAYAETCPANLDWNQSTGHYTATQNGVQWKSIDSYSSKTHGIVADYVEVKKADGKGEYLSSCRYTNDARHNPKIVIDMVPATATAEEKTLVTPRTGFVNTGVKVNFETVSQCQLNNGGSNNCSFSLIKSASPQKTVTANPFSASQADCSAEQQAFNIAAAAFSNNPTTENYMNMMAAQSRLVACQNRPSPPPSPPIDIKPRS